MKFTPKFQHLQIPQPGGGMRPLNPSYSLTDASADDLVALLAGYKGLDGVTFQIAVVQRPPLSDRSKPGEGWNWENLLVPYLRFQDGPDSEGEDARFSYLNAGLLADIWTHGIAADSAMRVTLATIARQRYEQNPDRNPIPS